MILFTILSTVLVKLSAKPLFILIIFLVCQIAWNYLVIRLKAFKDWKINLAHIIVESSVTLLYALELALYLLDK